MRTTAIAARFLGLLAAAHIVTACAEPAQAMGRAEARFSQCSPCHGEKGEGKLEQIAPPIAGLPAWYVESQLLKFRSGARGSHFDDAGGLRMKPMALALPTDADVKEMAAYVAQLPPPPRMAGTLTASPTAGRALYATCAACHGADGSGNQALNAPPIAGQADWYVYTQLKNFKHGVRGANPKDATGATMRAIAQGLPDDAALQNVAQFVSELPIKR